MRQDYNRFLERGSEVLAVGPNDARAFRDYWEREGLPFVGLADPRHSVAKLYHQQVKLLKLGRMPALLVVDRDGLIRYRHHGESMSDIPSNDEVLAVLDRLNDRLVSR